MQLSNPELENSKTILCIECPKYMLLRLINGKEKLVFIDKRDMLNWGFCDP